MGPAVTASSFYRGIMYSTIDKAFVSPKAGPFLLATAAFSFGYTLGRRNAANKSATETMNRDLARFSFVTTLLEGSFEESCDSILKDKAKLTSVIVASELMGYDPSYVFPEYEIEKERMVRSIFDYLYTIYSK